MEANMFPIPDVEQTPLSNSEYVFFTSMFSVFCLLAILFFSGIMFPGEDETKSINTKINQEKIILNEIK